VATTMSYLIADRVHDLAMAMITQRKSRLFLRLEGLHGGERRMAEDPVD